MLRQTLLALAIYLLGACGLVYWSVTGLSSGAPREDWALMIVLPMAWLFSYWPMLGSLLTIARIRSIQRTVEGIAAQLDTGLDPSPERLRELEDMGTVLAARENRVPRFLVRPFIRKALNQAARNGVLQRIVEKGSDKSAG